MLKVKDPSEKHYIDKAEMFDLPARLILVGKSQYSGKTSCLVNLLEQEDPRLYKRHFDGDNIFIFSSSLGNDQKLQYIIDQHEIPSANLYEGFCENILCEVIESIEDQYQDCCAEEIAPPHSLVVLDDCSWGGGLKRKQHGAIAKLFCNSRHYNVSVILTSQKYSSVLTTARENATGCIFWKCSQKQLDLIANDHNFLPKKKVFNTMFRTLTEKPHSFMVVNYSNTPERLYMNSSFQAVAECGEPIDSCSCSI